MKWVIENKLARSCRPGYADERVAPQDVLEALSEWQGEGIRSIICLLADEQLGYYNDLPGGLLNAYHQAGFEVVSIKVPDYQDPPLSDSDLGRVLTAYNKLPKPCLVHCSAGVDRTGAAVEYLVSR